jgi:hypothetical protein
MDGWWPVQVTRPARSAAAAGPSPRAQGLSPSRGQGRCCREGKRRVRVDSRLQSRARNTLSRGTRRPTARILVHAFSVLAVPSLPWGPNPKTGAGVAVRVQRCTGGAIVSRGYSRPSTHETYLTARASRGHAGCSATRRLNGADCSWFRPTKVDFKGITLEVGFKTVRCTVEWSIKGRSRVGHLTR